VSGAASGEHGVEELPPSETLVVSAERTQAANSNAKQMDRMRSSYAVGHSTFTSIV
jgi:hypothetical protein